jgi:hypothetical protein
MAMPKELTAALMVVQQLLLYLQHLVAVTKIAALLLLHLHHPQHLIAAI